MKKSCLFWQMLLCLCISSFSTYGKPGNTVLDSLLAVSNKLPDDTNKVKVQIAICNYYDSISDYGKMQEMAKTALALSEKLQYAKGMGDAHFKIGLSFHQKTELQQAFEEYHLAQDIYTKINDQEGLATVYGHIGVIYTLQGNYPEALKNMLLGMKIRERSGNIKSIAKAYANIGGLYRSLGEFSKALEYLFKAYEVEKNFGNKKGMAKNITNIGNVYRMQWDLKNALHYYLESYNLNQQIKSKDGLTKAGHNIGEVYSLMGIELKKSGIEKDSMEKYFALANTYLEASLKSALEINDRVSAGADYVDIGLLQLYQDKPALGRKNLLLGLALSKEINHRDFIKESYHRLAMIDSATGNYKGAFENHKLYMLYNDSLFNEANTKKITQQQMQFEFDRKAQLASIEQERKDILTQAQLNRQKLIALMFIIISIMILAAGFLYYSRNKLRRQSESQAAELKRLNEIESIRGRISRDLHDDIGSTLSSINILSQLEEKDRTKNEIVLKKIGESSSKMMQAMDDIVWAVNPGNDSLEKIVVRMREYAAEIFEAKNIDYKFNISDQLSGLKMDMEQRRDLFLIYKEAINNLAKYSNCSDAEINLFSDKGEVKLEVKDNGKGFNMNSSGSGNGLLNMKRRAENLKADLSLDSIEGTGTTLKLRIPIT